MISPRVVISTADDESINTSSMSSFSVYISATASTTRFVLDPFSLSSFSFYIRATATTIRFVLV